VPANSLKTAQDSGSDSDSSSSSSASSSSSSSSSSKRSPALAVKPSPSSNVKKNFSFKLNLENTHKNVSSEALAPEAPQMLSNRPLMGLSLIENRYLSTISISHSLTPLL